MKVIKLERVYFSTIAVRLGAAIHMETSIDQVNILVCGWNNRRERKGLSRINFAQRIKDENEWRATRGLPPDYERFMFVDELELFSRYAGYTAFGLTSCNVVRTVTNRSEFYQRGDTSVTIQTKTIESYDAKKNLAY